MKRWFFTGTLAVIFFILTAAGASAAVVNDTVKIGLRYGSDALSSANLENAEGSGYAFGYFDESRNFTSLGWTEQTKITMNTSQTGNWHVEIGEYNSFEAASADARDYGGYPAWIQGAYVVRVGSYSSQSKASQRAEEIGGRAASSSSTGVLVTVTNSENALFEFDGGGTQNLGVQPQGTNPVTWFKGARYRGSFEYLRAKGGSLTVINVLNLEDYVKGVVPSEMIASWPMAALEAQAVCSRTFACYSAKHKNSGFDLCTNTDCQVYKGVTEETAQSNQAVENTRSQCLYYNGAYIESVYHSSDGGATESAVNVWDMDAPYLIGKQDPYENLKSSYSTTYTAKELTWILQQKGYNLGTIQNVYVSEFTALGNVSKVTFIDTAGKTLTVQGDTCRTIFYSSTYKKSVKSLRFTINGAAVPTPSGTSPDAGNVQIPSGGGYSVNGTSVLPALNGAAVLSDSGIHQLGEGSYSVITASGIGNLSEGGTLPVSSASTGSNIPVSRPSNSGNGTFTITGTGSGHNVGMSQSGAKAMAEQGYSYQDILFFYYTNVELR